MLRRAAALASILLAAGTAGAAAQQYPMRTPAPKTTSLPQLRALARTREISERFTMGVADEQRGEYAAAIPEFERIAALRPPEPEYSTAQYDLGIAYANTGRPADAAAAFQSAIAADPGFLAAMANLIAVELAAGNVNAARAAADKFVKAAPDSARALYSRGIVALQQNDLATARTDFSQLLKSDPRYALGHYDLGVTESRAGRWNSAEREFLLALDLAPGYARARFALGTVLLREGRRSDARSQFDRVVRDPNGDVALQSLAQAMRDAIHAP
ncbi:MAG TPA: tetratricopeptide repeat protein [Candidatus Baltobacteraceae bacterium]|nr:tetratricopeptide repeat protein [Candidatus Baltobacteraceae bacterium]